MKLLYRQTLTEIAKTCDFDAAQVSRYLRGKMSPSLDNAKKLANSMCLTLDELYDVIDWNRNNAKK